MLRQDIPPYRIGRALIGLLMVISLLPGCNFRETPQSPQLWIKIDSPASGMEVRIEEEIAIQSTATSSSAVSWIELWVDGELMDTTQAPTPLQPGFSAVQHWQAAAPGEHLLEVRAYDEKGTVSPAASIVLRVGSEEVQLMPTATPEERHAISAATPLPTVPLPTTTATVLACDSDSEFVEDLTVPDNTEIAAGTQFEKTWRGRNNGTCPWSEGYGLVFAEGEQMAGPDRTSIPQTAPEGEADIRVTLVAPDKPGTYRGDWRLSGPDGEPFGAKFYVQIVVVTAAITPEVTATVGITVPPAVTITATPTVTATTTPTTTA